MVSPEDLLAGLSKSGVHRDPVLGAASDATMRAVAAGEDEERASRRAMLRSTRGGTSLESRLDRMHGRLVVGGGGDGISGFGSGVSLDGAVPAGYEQQVMRGPSGSGASVSVVQPGEGSLLDVASGRVLGSGDASHGSAAENPYGVPRLLTDLWEVEIAEDDERDQRDGVSVNDSGVGDNGSHRGAALIKAAAMQSRSGSKSSRLMGSSLRLSISGNNRHLSDRQARAARSMKRYPPPRADVFVRPTLASVEAGMYLLLDKAEEE